MAAVDWDSYALSRVDERLEAYVREVAMHPEGHNVYEQLAVIRFLTLFDKYGINVTEVRKFFTLYESLTFQGDRGATHYKLTPVQTFQFASIFGFWNGDRRVTREAVLFVPRKFSKTTSCAALAVYDLLFGDANAECYTGANSQTQALRCFRVIRDCIMALDPEGRRYVANLGEIRSRRSDRTALAQSLTSNARTKDGLSASTVIMDEFSQAKDNQLLTVLTTSMAVRKNPLTVIITTASDVFDGPFYAMLQGYKSLLLGDIDDDTVFAHIFEPDLDDPEDSEQTWRKVQPHWGVTVDPEFYAREYQSALRNGAEAMLAFRTKMLNVYAVNEQRSWISPMLARQQSRPFDIRKVQGYPDAMIAVDLSVSDDFSAVTTGIYDEATATFMFDTAYFFPREALPGHPNEALYRTWSEQGHLRLTEGNVIDYEQIAAYVDERNDYVRTVRIGYDPYKSLQFINILASTEARDVLYPVRQTYGTFTSAVEMFEHGIKTGQIFINDNPINFYCFGNAVLDYDRLENCKPVKRTHNGKIDGVITMLMSMHEFIVQDRN